MHWNNSETVVNTSTGKSLDEKMQLIDSQGQLVAEFSKPASGDSELQLPSGSNVQTVYSAPFEIDHADILTLPTTGVTLVAAQGATKLVLPESIVLRHKWTADYTNIDAAATLTMRFGGTDMLFPFRQEVQSGVAGLLAGGGPDGSIGYSQRFMLANVAAAPGAVAFRATSSFYDSDLLNTALVLAIDNALAGDLTGGNAANKLHGWVNYSVYDFSYFA